MVRRLVEIQAMRRTPLEDRTLVWYHRIWRRWTKKNGGPRIGGRGAERRMALCMRAAYIAAAAGTAPWAEITEPNGS